MIASITLINQVLLGHGPMGVSISLMLVILQATVILFGYLHLFTKNRKGTFSLLGGSLRVQDHDYPYQVFPLGGNILQLEPLTLVQGAMGVSLKRLQEGWGTKQLNVMQHTNATITPIILLGTIHLYTMHIS